MSDNNNPNFPGLPSLPQRPNLNRPSNVGAQKPTAQPPSFPKPTLPTRQSPEPQETLPSVQPGQYAPEPQQYAQPAQTYVPETQHYAPTVQAYAPEPQRQAPAPEPTLKEPAAETPKERSTKMKRRAVKDKPKKEQKPSAYAGKRKNVLIARVVVGAILAILVGNGIVNMIPKTSGLTASDGPLIISEVRKNLNVSKFPRTQGEGVATAFTSVYLNYDPANAAERAEELKNFAPEKIISANEIRTASEEELVKIGLSKDTKSVAQRIVRGPYVTDSLMFAGGTAAMITTMSQMDSGKWVYLQIPMYYNEANDNVTVSGEITFSAPNRTTEVPEIEITDSWNNDTEIVSKIQPDITTYMSSWVASDTENIERYLYKENGQVASTLEARKGLGGNLEFLNVTSFSVESKERPEEETAANMIAYNTRQAEVEVTLLDRSSNLVYTQRYRLVIRYANNDWFVEDIRNRVVALDREVIMAETK